MRKALRWKKENNKDLKNILRSGKYHKITKINTEKTKKNNFSTEKQRSRKKTQIKNTEKLLNGSGN